MSDVSAEQFSALQREVEDQKETIARLASLLLIDKVEFYPFEPDLKPVRMTDGAIGYDSKARAIVDPLSKPTELDPLRRCMADFKKTPGWNERVDERLQDLTCDDEEGRPDYYSLVLPPKQVMMVGLGFATGMPFPMYYWVAPRSGHASRMITIANSPGTVDPDYRGEAGALMFNHSTQDFKISYGMRIAQIVFSVALIPNLIEVDEHSKLGSTTRAAGGFGSTGSH